MPESAPPAGRVSVAGDAHIFPLKEFYSRAKLPLPRIEVIAGDVVPEPYKSLLVHSNDMTPTLESFHKSDIHLEILSRERRGDFYFREVILRLNGSDQPVEFGANKVYLGRFPEEAQDLILAEQVPLGRILKDCGVHHRTEVKAFLRVQSEGRWLCRVRARAQGGGPRGRYIRSWRFAPGSRRRRRGRPSRAG